jgi:threonine/homoserine/homoserine lactone efflux protein
MLATLAALISLGITSFVIALSGALMPGPLLTVTIAESSRRGFWVGPVMIAGHALLELAMVALLVAGVGPLLTNQAVSGVVGIVGAGVLLWMAFGLLRAVPDLTVESEMRQRSTARHPLVYGILMSLANPYWTMWWATLGLGLITSSLKLGFMGLGAFFAGHIAGDLLWYSLIAFSFSHGRRFLNDRVYKAVMLVCGLALVGFALWFGWRGVVSVGR